jgi:hypothetical protein
MIGEGLGARRAFAGAIAGPSCAGELRVRNHPRNSAVG